MPTIVLTLWIDLKCQRSGCLVKKEEEPRGDGATGGSARAGWRCGGGGGAVQELGQPTVELSQSPPLRQTPTGLLKTCTNHFCHKDLYWGKRKYSHIDMR